MSVARPEAKSPVQVDAPGISLTAAQLRRRRARSIAIGLALGALVILFWAVTIVRLGGNVVNRSL
ncbi:hypothetical protein C3941_09970 [Kaistia algarum]|uniref:hypothetical protein n=1 Tax=Kaistia algarum TaxID=2083279 RepID=UPI000CE7D2C7|nr:hypothetical protein [Kaistia algarum]MCX5512384.1 hypothetical protein [Kaistia algarum]PPE80465.1 hypothetical protein C3941_09970 [Kaistia algarum]